MDIQQLLGQQGGGMPGQMPGMMSQPAVGGQDNAALLPFLLMLLQQMLGQSGQMPMPSPQGGGGGGMPFLNALSGGGQLGGGPQPPMMPPGLG